MEVALTDMNEIKKNKHSIEWRQEHHSCFNNLFMSAGCLEKYFSTCHRKPQKKTKKCSICIYEGEIQQKKLGVRMSKALQTFPVCDTLAAAAGWEGSYVSSGDKWRDCHTRQIQHFAPFRSSRLTCWWTAGSTRWRNATVNSTRCTKWWEWICSELFCAFSNIRPSEEIFLCNGLFSIRC